MRRLDCCANTGSGQATAALPISVMKSRRLIIRSSGQRPQRTICGVWPTNLGPRLFWLGESRAAAATVCFTFPDDRDGAALNPTEFTQSLCETQRLARSISLGCRPTGAGADKVRIGVICNRAFEL
jgi:hypothetical protein